MGLSDGTCGAKLPGKPVAFPSILGYFELGESTIR